MIMIEMINYNDNDNDDDDDDDDGDDDDDYNIITTRSTPRTQTSG